MRKLFLILSIGILALLSACNDDNSSIVETEDVIMNTSELSYGYTDTEKTINIEVKEGTNYSWRIKKLRDKSWLKLEADSGAGSKLIKVSVDRSKMNYGYNFDTLEIRFSEIKKINGLQALKDSVKRIPVTAQKIAYYADILTEKVGNGVQILNTYTDSSYCFLGSFRVETDQSTIQTAFATFYANSIPFADAGNSVTFKGKQGLPNLVNVDLQRESFNFTPTSSSAR